MTDDYFETYGEARRAMDEAGYDVTVSGDTNRFSRSYFDNAAEMERFETRAAMERKLGAKGAERGHPLPA